MFEPRQVLIYIILIINAKRLQIYFASLFFVVNLQKLSFYPLPGIIPKRKVVFALIKPSGSSWHRSFKTRNL